MSDRYYSIVKQVKDLAQYRIVGRIISVVGLLIKCVGIHRFVAIGSHCSVITQNGDKILCEVVALNGETVSLLSFTKLDGISLESELTVTNSEHNVYPDISWKGRVINAMGEAMDEKGTLKLGLEPYSYKTSPLPFSQRNMIGKKIDLGIKAINSFIPCCDGQRLGVFAGSGVGKSVLMSMIAKYASTDIKVIGLIGERGREVKEFIDKYLGEEGLKNSIIVVATSDESSLMRCYAAYLTISLAEFFSDQGMSVLCMIDSVTRFAMAHREIGLSLGEPPVNKGYTPSVFTQLPKLLERAGPRKEGNITGIFTVLVEGDDNNEPISDTVRGILDGHIVMDRKIAERGRFPAIDVLRSVSRTLPQCNSEAENEIMNRAKSLLSTYDDMEDMIRLGAYQAGTDPKVDEAVKYHEQLDKFLAQSPEQNYSIEYCFQELSKILAEVQND